MKRGRPFLLFPALIIRHAVFKGHIQIRFIQSVSFKFIIRYIIGHIIGQIQFADNLHISVNIFRIKRNFFSVFLRKKYVFLTISNLIVFFIYGFIILAASKLYLCNRIKLWYLIMLYHLAKLNIKCIQRILLYQIHIAVSHRYIPFLIHFAVIAQRYLIVLLSRSDLDLAQRIIKTILA